MKRPIFPRPRRATPFAEKFGRDVEYFGRGRKPEPPPKTYFAHVIIGMVCALFLCLGICLLGMIPKVRTVSAVGGRIYSDSVMLHYADLDTGDLLWGFDTKDVEKQMKRYMPLLSSAKVKKHLNGNVSIRATEYEKLYYTCHNRNYYIFTTDDWHVLCAMATDEEARRVGAVYIGLPESAKVRVGESISFINLPYDPETHGGELSTVEVETDVPEKENAYVHTFVDTLLATSFADRLVGMELADRYNLYFVLDGGIKVSLGDMSELDEKLRIFQRTLKEREDAGMDAGELPIAVDASDPSRITFRASPDVKLPPWN